MLRPYAKSVLLAVNRVHSNIHVIQDTKRKKLDSMCCHIFQKINTIKLLIEALETKIAEFVNSINLEEAAHDEPPLLNLCCFLSGL